MSDESNLKSNTKIYLKETAERGTTPLYSLVLLVLGLPTHSLLLTPPDLDLYSMVFAF